MSGTMSIAGAVAAPAILGAAALASDYAPVTVTLANGDSYVGASVYSLISGAGFLYPTGASVKNGFLRDYIAVGGAGGGQVVLSEGEVDPGFGGASSTDIIAYQRNGAAIAPELIVPGDLGGGIGKRDVTGVTSLSVGVAAVPAAATGAAGAVPLTVGGDVSEAANPYGAAAVQAIGRVAQSDSFSAGSAKASVGFTGAPLQSVLNSAGIDGTAAGNEYVVATGTDGYGVVYSRGEIDPSIRGTPAALIAYDDGTGTFPSVGGISGALRTTAPGDAKGGRYVSSLDSVTVGRPQDDAVLRLYKGAFGRTPDEAGGAYWSGLLQDGLSLLSVAQGLLGSAEFQSDAGAAAGNAGFVKQLYTNEAGRAGDAAGLSFWTGLLDGGTSRAAVLAGFASAPEATLHASAPQFAP